MKTIKRFVAFSMLACLPCFTLTACGGEEGPAEEMGEATEEMGEAAEEMGEAAENATENR